MIYLFISSLFFIVIPNYTSRNIKFNLIYLLILLGVFAGIRYETGSDYNNYIRYYNSFSSIENFELTNIFSLKHELGFTIVNILTGPINHYSSMFLLNAYISFYFLYKSINEISNKKLMLFCLIFYYLKYYYQLNFAIIRQGTSISIILYSLKYLINKNNGKFILCTILATLFHASSIVSLILLFLYKKRIQKKYYLLILFFTICIAYSGIMSLALMKSMSFLPDFIYGRLLSYILGRFGNSLESYFGIVIKLFTFIFILIFIDYKEKNSIIFNFYFIGLVIYFLLMDFGTLGTRISKNFEVAEIILIPESIAHIKSKPIKYLFLCLFILIFSYYAFRLVTSPGYINYKSILF